MNCEQAKSDLAAEMLAGRDEPRDAAHAAHLRGCPSCRRERAELRQVIRLLSGVSPSELMGIPPAPDPERAIAALRGEAPAVTGTGAIGPAGDAGQRGRHTHLAVAVAFAAGLIFGGGMAVAVAGNAGQNSAERQALVAGPVRSLHARDVLTGVEGEVETRARRWGTEVRLTLSGVEGPRRCSLVAIGESSRREVICNWAVSGRRDAQPGEGRPRLNLAGSSSLLQQEITAFEVEASDGEVLLRLAP
ncbi:hypothetical protein [Streptomyces sp. NPDC096105]|uniref:hypothetical protein n=1 Tax=Streptomyces sp. NPDC096105 TaxID=3366074 RepID=UPI00381F46E3